MLLQEVVYEALQALCQRLPEQQASLCALQVKANLPKVLQQTTHKPVSLALGPAAPIVVVFTTD